MRDLKKEWNIDGSLERWGECFLDIMTCLFRANNHMVFNPETEDRITKIVAGFLDKERAGEITAKQLNIELSEENLFTAPELKNSKETLLKCKIFKRVGAA